MPIKYLGSKRRLVPQLGQIAVRAGAKTAVDLFTGTTRVAQEFKRNGIDVTCVDTARYAEVFAKCYIETDATTVDTDQLETAIGRLASLPGKPGYVTDVFCNNARYFQPHNGERIDAIRDVIEAEYAESWMYPILLTSLIEAADRVDSTTGLQMAYVKSWSKRSYNDLQLRVPTLIPGTGRAVRGDAVRAAPELGRVDLAYLDPPYNQHRYFTNYHVWETLVAWDRPEHYGVACKRIDSRDAATKSVFNLKREMPEALKRIVTTVNAGLVVLSYNNESWVDLDTLVEWMGVHGDVNVLEFESKRYVGAQIGIYSPAGDKVGKVSHLKNIEYVVVAGDQKNVAAMCDEATQRP